MSFNDGVLEENEIEVITNVLKLKQTLVKDVMTPRKMIFSLNENAIIQSIINDEQIVVHSRILLQKEDKDDIDSYVLKNDILTANGDTKLKDIEKNIITVSHLDNLSYILNKFLLTKEHIFLVLDEYHQVDGIITMEDLFETLIGKEITDETDVIEDLAKYAKEY
jgi:CBS domain containing-hemolysin-like protein